MNDAHERPERGNVDLPERIGSFRVLHMLGEGAAGVVYAVQRDESRTVSALKVLHPSLSTTNVLERFRREAEILRRLRHPGIAAFYDAGDMRVETSGGSVEVPYLSLEYVEGQPPAQHAVRRQLDVPQRIELVARIADALHHAHEAGVVHRDLKPSNVLVSREGDDPVGRPKLLDFGVARASITDADVFETNEHVLLGTLPYMSPEQVSSGSVDRRSDVYALGVLLYELLSGRLPYDVKGRPVAAAVRAIRSEEPTRLGRIARSLDGDVQHVVAQALEKDPARRYATAADLARDLRAAAEGRPVQARAPGLARRTRRWSRRYPVAATVLAIGGVGLVAVLALWRNAVRARDDARVQASLAETRSIEAGERLDELERERTSLLLLADREELMTLSALGESLWPVHPDRVPALREWITRATVLAGNLEAHVAALAAFEAAQDDVAETQYERDWWRTGQAELVRELEEFCSPQGQLARVQDRLLASETLRERTLDEHRDLWLETIAAVRESPAYGGLELAPQLGLVPLGEDPSSGLHEFWHVESGARPERGPDAWAIGPETGIVFVLLPGGAFSMGAQSSEPTGANYDPDAAQTEQPVHEVVLAPFFMSKYELTQGQWARAERSRPSSVASGIGCSGVQLDSSWPVETVSWREADRALGRLDVTLPSEAQWEYAARGGVDAPWSCGRDRTALELYANVADLTFQDQGGLAHDGSYEPWRDGVSCTARVGSFAPNPFGLHDMHGNVWEWCRDVFRAWFYETGPSVDPVAEEPEGREAPYRILRGGCYSTDASLGRSSARLYFDETSLRHSGVGVRAARALRSALLDR